MGWHRRLWANGDAVLGAAAFVCSLVGLQIKLLSAELPASLITASSSLVGLLLTSALLAASTRRHVALQSVHKSSSYARLAAPAGVGLGRQENRRTMGLLVLRGFLGAAAVGCYYASVELLPLNIATTIFFLNPAAAVLLEALIYWQVPSAAATCGCLLTLCGVVLIGAPSCPLPAGLPAALAAAAGQALPATGIALGVVAAIANAASFCTVSLIGPQTSPIVVTWWYHAIVLLASLVPLAARATAWQLPSRHDAGLLVGVALANFVGQLLLNRGFALQSASRGSALNTAQVLYAYLWELVALHHAPGSCAVVGSAVIVAGVLVVCWQRAPGGAGAGGPLPHSHLPAAAKPDGGAGAFLEEEAELRRRLSFESEGGEVQHAGGGGGWHQGSADLAARVGLEAPLLDKQWGLTEDDGSSGV